MFKSYELLKLLGEQMEKEDASRLSLTTTDEEKLPYHEIYHKLERDLLASLILDLKKIFSGSIELVKSKFCLEDPEDQGASHVYFKFNLEEDNDLIEFKVDCKVFYNRIIISLDDLDFENLSTNSQNLKVFKKFNKIGSYNFYAELKSL
jgi:hypothetical protein